MHAFHACVAGVTPFWFWLAAKLEPCTYIRTAAVLIAASYCLTYIALYVTRIISLALLLVAITNLVASPTLSLGMLGQEDVDVFEVTHMQYQGLQCCQKPSHVCVVHSVVMPGSCHCCEWGDHTTDDEQLQFSILIE